MVALISMQNSVVNERSSLWLSRTSGPELGRKPDFTAKFICFGARALGKVKAFMLCSPI
jgi:hypothetical protein